MEQKGSPLDDQMESYESGLKDEKAGEDSHESSKADHGRMGEAVDAAVMGGGHGGGKRGTRSLSDLVPTGIVCQCARRGE